MLKSRPRGPFGDDRGIVQRRLAFNIPRIDQRLPVEQPCHHFRIVHPRRNVQRRRTQRKPAAVDVVQAPINVARHDERQIGFEYSDGLVTPAP